MTSSAHVVGRMPPLQRAHTRLRHATLERYSIGLAGAVLVVIVLFSLMQKLISAPVPQPAAPTTVVDHVHLLDKPPPQQPQLSLPAMPTPTAAKPPPGPPSATPTAAPGLPSPTISPPAAPALDNIAATGVQVEIGSSANLLGSGKFAGFTGAGGTGGGNGYGSGQGFSGQLLIPLSTARPEIPKWAYEHKIEGWVTVVFTVNTQGRVENIRIVDAQPKGIFEAAAVKSIANWVYPAPSRPIEVQQRVEFKLKDYQYNWTTG